MNNGLWFSGLSYGTTLDRKIVPLTPNFNPVLKIASRGLRYPLQVRLIVKLFQLGILSVVCQTESRGRIITILHGGGGFQYLKGSSGRQVYKSKLL